MDPVAEPFVRIRHPAAAGASPSGCYGSGREFLGNRFVYLMFSARAGGLTLGVNLNPDRHCNFDCVYCEVPRAGALGTVPFDVEVMAQELEHALERLHAGQLRELPWLKALPADLLQLRHVALSGEGEPTLCPKFDEAVQAVVHVRARGHYPFFKIALLTNGTQLQEPQVQRGLKHLILKDEIWLKLDAGSAAAFERVNRGQVPFAQVLDNIRRLGTQRPIILQSLFPLMEGREPSEPDLEEYVSLVRQLQADRVQIELIQVYSATRPTVRSNCGHLPLKSLSRIAHRIRGDTGLHVEVF